MTAISREVERAIEWDCTQLLTRFFNSFDDWRYADMVAMFAPDGVWHRADMALKGSAIMEALNARSPTQKVRHIVTNVVVEAESETSAQFTLYVTAYMHDSGELAKAPPKIRMPYLMLVVPGRLVRIGDQWKIASMSMNREFEFEA